MPRYNLSDPELVATFIALRDKEFEDCQADPNGLCGKPGPVHFLPDIAYNSYQLLPYGGACKAGRHFDLDKRIFVGRPHCTCDWCY